jgi:hypothetical protein
VELIISAPSFVLKVSSNLIVRFSLLSPKVFISEKVNSIDLESAHSNETLKGKSIYV